MRIKFENGVVNADDYGDIHIYESHYHGEVKFGTMDEEGNFEPAYWFDPEEDFLDQLREVLRSQYFGEIKNYEEDKDQDSWAERYLDFMKLDELPAVGDEWKAIWEIEKEPIEQHIRYRKENKSPLHGIYYQSDNKVLQIIQDGKLLKSYQLLKGLSEEELNSDSWLNLLCDPQLNWTEKEPFSSISEGCFNQCLDEKQSFGVIYCSNNSRMMELAEQAEKQALKVMVFKHQQETQQFRLIIFKEKALESISRNIPELESSNENDIQERIKGLQEALNSEELTNEMTALSPFLELEQPKGELGKYLKYSLMNLPQSFCLSAALEKTEDDPQL